MACGHQCSILITEVLWHSPESSFTAGALHWHHNEHDSIFNHWQLDCLLDRLFRHRSKKTSQSRITGLCEGNSLKTGEFPTQRASNEENISIWWSHHGPSYNSILCVWKCVRKYLQNGSHFFSSFNLINSQNIPHISLSSKATQTSMCIVGRPEKTDHFIMELNRNYLTHWGRDILIVTIFRMWVGTVLLHFTHILQGYFTGPGPVK